MTVFNSAIMRRSFLVVAAAFTFAPVAAVAEEGGEREGGMFSGIFGQEERGFRENEGGEAERERAEERSGMFSRGEGGEEREEGGEGEDRRERSGMFSRGEGREGYEERSRRGGLREGGEREVEED